MENLACEQALQLRRTKQAARERAPRTPVSYRVRWSRDFSLLSQMRRRKPIFIATLLITWCVNRTMGLR